jgi:hypothetical protein
MKDKGELTEDERQRMGVLLDEKRQCEERYTEIKSG